MLLFLSCDMPFVSAGLRGGCSLNSHRAPARSLSVPATRSFRSSSGGLALQVVNGLQRRISPQSLARRLKARQLRVPPAQTPVFNVNTPIGRRRADAAAARGQVGRALARKPACTRTGACEFES